MPIPRKININDFGYALPDNRIAKFPLQNRDESKLLFYDKGGISGRTFNELPSLIDNTCDLIFNDTKVIRARLIFIKPTGSGIEIFLLEPHDPQEYTQSFAAQKECSWICLVGNAKKWKNEPLKKELKINGGTVTLQANMIQRTGNAFIIHFSWDYGSVNFSEIIAHAGLTPIPPYLNREAREDDIQRYQTVYSDFEGSVAAPTAGLHFTNGLMNELNLAGIKTVKLTLHVGAGTFIPVKEEDARKHIMHTEQIFISRGSIENLYYSENKHIAVGTTSVRTLESLYWIGVKMRNKSPDNKLLFLDQWEAYKKHEKITRKESMLSILNFMDDHKVQNLHAYTKIMIVPGYEFKMIDGMITNFHQPKSTLLLLIAAYVGDDWKKIYDYALNNNFRFLSYGDSSLILK